MFVPDNRPLPITRIWSGHIAVDRLSRIRTKCFTSCEFGRTRNIDVDACLAPGTCSDGTPVDGIW